MCGFIAIIKKNPITMEDMTFLHHGLEMIYHRGPDDQDVFYDAHAILGFNRLSINDLNTGGQPYHSKDGRFHLIFNGEIYNYLDLKTDLEGQGVSFDTNSEIEVISQLYERQGISFVKLLRGMYAIVIYDVQNQSFIVARDTFGIKPLYFYAHDDHFLASSELKLFKSLHLSETAFHFEGLQHYFTFQYVPEPMTIFKEVSVVPPGSVIEFKIGEDLITHQMTSVSLQPVQGKSQEKTVQIRDAIMNSVGAHLLSDVEVGTFLSGGIDSTIIAACAKAYHPNIKAFTIGFDVPGFSEIEEAKKSADYLNIDLTEVVIGAGEYLHAVKEVISYLDSPVADPSVMPIYLVAKAASEQVKVILSGEGSDELFGGYGIYREPQALAPFSKFPKIIEKGLLASASLLPDGMRGKRLLQRGCTPLTSRYVGNAFVFNELEKEVLLHFYNKDIHFTDVTHPIYQTNEHLDLVSQMQSIDLYTWLRGDILVKSDRLSMAHSLELRVPFLDSEVFKIAKTLTADEKIKGKTTKYLLREAFKDLIPPHIYGAKKKGYPVPLNVWLQDELYDFAKETLLSPAVEHLIDQPHALFLLDAHGKKKHNYSRKIWTLITFILWYEQWIGNALSY